MEERTGIISAWVFERGFGFIIDSTSTKYFLHFNRITSGKPFVGATVKFKVLPLIEGKSPSAIDAVIAEGAL